ncbi:hypothetical protein [Nevskia sp.]|uniref:hypothetical protein n=1 Tax=Nevskia sp. TaxID=1929292 RepID=UPI0025FC370D|nr:hypothetical protein [Nevskia sp.]
MSRPLLPRGLCVLVLGFSASAGAQTQEPPNWNLTAPATTTQAPPMQRRQLPRMQQPMPPEPAAIDSHEVQASQVPDGYQALRVPPGPAVSAADHDRRMESQLPEGSMPEQQQIAILRKRVAELIRQMDDLQVRMRVSEQLMATHRHGYSVPNMGFISGKSYSHWLKRADEANTLVPFFSGSSRDGTTTPSVMPK